MKKILPVALIGLATITSVYASENSKKYNTINYTTQAETSIKSDSILVQITGYATTNLQDQTKVEKELANSVKSVLDADWKVKDVSQNTSQSGALNITLELQARVSQEDLNKLQSTLENQKLSNQKLVVQVLDYNPPAKAIEQAKQELMIDIYSNTQKYLEAFNKQTKSNYIIQSVDYNDPNIYTPRTSNMMFMKSSANYDTNSNQANTNVSKDINIKATVTFIER
ncbi:MAG: hypothetical protein ACI8TE_001625 [Francisella sp.]|jgi:hypothetical protein